MIPCKATIPPNMHRMELVQNIARLGSGTGESGETITRAKYCTGKPFYFIPPQNYPTAFFSGWILSYLILPYPTLSYFFAHAMISLGGRLLKWLLYAKALLRGELSAQQTEGFQMPPHADSKQNGITPCEAAVPSKLHGMEAVQNIARPTSRAEAR